MRVLHLIPSWVGGGAERQLALLAAPLCTAGVETHIGFLHPGVNLTIAQRSNAVLHQLRGLGNHDPSLLLQTIRLVNRVRPAIVQTWLRQMDVLGGIAAMQAHIPHILSERSSRLAYPPSWKHWLRVQIGKRSSLVVANSRAGLDYWSQFVPNERLALVRNGLSPASEPEMSIGEVSIEGVPNDARLIVFAGRLTKLKNIETLVPALDRVLEKHSDAFALLFGEGELREQITALISQARCSSRIKLLRYTNRLPAWMRKARVFVSISWAEGNPNTVLEAMSLGCPLVVSDIPEHREFLDESMAVLCNPSAIDDVSNAICRALGDPEQAAVRSAAARVASANWTMERCADEYVRIYETVLAR